MISPSNWPFFFKSLPLKDNTGFCSIMQASKWVFGSLLATNNFFVQFWTIFFASSRMANCGSGLPYQNLDDVFEVWTWISNFIPHCSGHRLSMLGLKLNHECTGPRFNLKTVSTGIEIPYYDKIFYIKTVWRSLSKYMSNFDGFSVFLSFNGTLWNNRCNKFLWSKKLSYQEN